jgi:hypothetical protein
MVGMGKWYEGIYKISRIFILAALVGISLNVSVSRLTYADDNPNPNDGGDGEDTDFARAAIVKTQI